MNRDKNTPDRDGIIILILMLITILCVCVTILTLLLHKKSVITPDYAPQNIETNVEQIKDDTSIKLDAPQGGGAISVQYSKDVKIDLSDKIAYITYKNPSKSTHDTVIQLLIKDEPIAQSGTIPPGYKLEKLDLSLDINNKITDGVYKDAKIKVLSYDPETREKSMIDAELIVDITVQK